MIELGYPARYPKRYLHVVILVLSPDLADFFPVHRMSQAVPPIPLQKDPHNPSLDTRDLRIRNADKPPSTQPTTNQPHNSPLHTTMSSGFVSAGTSVPTDAWAVAKAAVEESKQPKAPEPEDERSLFAILQANKGTFFSTSPHHPPPPPGIDTDWDGRG